MPLATQPPTVRPRVSRCSVAFSLGSERYRYPQNLPKVAAKGGPQCAGELPGAVQHIPAVRRRRCRH